MNLMELLRQMPGLIPSAQAADAWKPTNAAGDVRVTSGAAGAPVVPPTNPNVGFSRNQNLGTAGPVVPGTLVYALMQRGMNEAQARATAATMGR